MSTTTHYNTPHAAAIQIVASHHDTLHSDQIPGQREFVDGKALVSVALTPDTAAGQSALSLERLVGDAVKAYFDESGATIAGRDVADLTIDEIDVLPTANGKFFAWVTWSAYGVEAPEDPYPYGHGQAIGLDFWGNPLYRMGDRRRGPTPEDVDRDED